MEGLMVLLFLAAIVIIPVLVTYYAIAPVHRASRGHRKKIHIYLIDIIALLVLIQVVLAITVPVFRERFERRSYFIAALLAGLIVVMWRAAVDVLSQLEVRQSSRRLLMHLVFLPGACGVMVATGFAIAMIVAVFESPDATAWEWLGWTLAIVGVGVWFLRSMSSWILRGRTVPAANSVESNSA